MTDWYAPNQQCVGTDINRTANGAIAGTPGTFTPPEQLPPQTIYEMHGLVATPATPWTTGQYVRLGDGTDATWSGTNWVGGRAPLTQRAEE